MKETPPHTTADGHSDGTFSPVELRRLRESPLNGPVWKCLLWAMAGTVLGSAMHLFGDATSVWFTAGVAVLLASGWYWAIRFLLLDIGSKRFWLVWLGLGLASILLSGSHAAGSWTAFGMVIAFLVFRRYRPLRHLTSIRRAYIFPLGLIALVLNFSATIHKPDDLNYFTGMIVHTASYCLWSLRFFWILSLLSLLLHMRLHFMRLRPKMAVNAILIGLVPPILVLALAAVVMYGTLGIRHAAQSRNIMQTWSANVDDGVDYYGHLFQTCFRYSEHQKQSVPEWADAFAEKILTAVDNPPVQHPADSLDTVLEFPDEETDTPLAWIPTDTTAYFLIDKDVWLLKVRGITSGDLEMTGYQVDSGVLDRLSEIVRADTRLTATQFDIASGSAVRISGHRPRPADDDVGESVEDDTGVTAAAADSLVVRPDDPNQERDREEGFWPWEKNPFFGSAMLSVIRPVRDGFETENLLVTLFIPPLELVKDLYVGEFGYTYLIGMLILVGVFTPLMLFAQYFSTRITGGIIDAVHALHRATLRLAGGDLTARVDIPNEDEFGDLAVSFNAMTVAIEQGRDDALTRAQLIREMETAREIQQRLLPDGAPELNGFEITGTSVPSRQVGGDYYDFLMQDSQRLGVAIGDVSGKGMPAALLMSNLQASLHGQVIHPSSVAEVVSRVNDLLVHSTDPHMFATFFYGLLDIRAGSFTVSNAGHNPPLVVRTDGQVVELGVGGLLLGMLPQQEYRQQTVELLPGDVAVLYTDGITEAVGPAPGRDELAPEDEGEDPDAMFGDDTLLEVIQESRHLSAAGIRESILSAVSKHTAGVPQSDDITLVVIKRRGQLNG